MSLVDSQGRNINYLRLSVTDRCNLRCTYCMPSAGVPMLGHGEILTFEELLRVAEAAVEIGVEKVRVTGGEPLVRKGILSFLERLAAIPGLKRLVLTTNGVLLKEMAADLRGAGVESLNISLDSMRPDTFAGITRGGDVGQVLAGIAAAERAGFEYIKINVVVMRGVNDDEVAEFAALTLKRPWRVRFIEYMPSQGHGEWQALSVPGEELLAKLARHYNLQPVQKEALSGPASYYKIAGAVGQIGFITPVSCHFCRECNRIRVTSTGFAKSCLFAEAKTDLRPFFLEPDGALLRDALRQVIRFKPERHTLSEDAGHLPLPMSQVGG